MSQREVRFLSGTVYKSGRTQISDGVVAKRKGPPHVPDRRWLIMGGEINAEAPRRVDDETAPSRERTGRIVDLPGIESGEHSCQVHVEISKARFFPAVCLVFIACLSR